MNLLKKCHSCGNKKLFVKRRKYRHPFIGEIMSREELCKGCLDSIIEHDAANLLPK